MFGKGSGWGIPTAASSLAITLGGLAPKPVVVDGRIAIRDLLCMTVSFDHRITDGAPAARFTDRLRELIESGYGLPNLAVEQTQTTGQEAPHVWREGLALAQRAWDD